jgi:peptidoglycan-N-acetylglucosamine deacetylase
MAVWPGGPASAGDGDSTPVAVLGVPSIDQWAQGFSVESAVLRPALRSEAVQVREVGPVCQAGELLTGVDVGQRKLVVFTYDDGPWPVLTRQIMTTFEARGVSATFFMVGDMVREYPEIARDIVNRGHEIGNHSMHHNYSPSKIAIEVKPTNDLIERITGVRPVLFRSPGLTRGNVIQDALADEGMCNIFSTADLRDYAMPRPSAATLCSSFAATLHPGFVALLHDGGGSKQNTVDAVDCMLDVVERRGYTVVSLSELLSQGRHYFGARQTSNAAPGGPTVTGDTGGPALPFDDLFDE